MFKVISIGLLAAIGSFPSVSSAQTVIPSLPYVIRSPGLYLLKESLSYSGFGFAAIVVSTGNVTIDLQGFSISNPVVGRPTSAIAIFGVNVPKVTVQNGSIDGFSVGIKLQSEGGSEQTSSLIENVRFNNVKDVAVALFESRNAIVRNCQIEGIGYDAKNMLIPGATGIGISDVNSAGGNLMTGNNISGAGQTGIVLGSNDLADGNFITNAPSGIRCKDTTSKMKNNTVSQSAVPYTNGVQLPGTNF